MGGKAEGLLFLEQNGFNTPVFYLVPDAVVKFYLKHNILPEGLTDRWMDTYRIAQDSLWAVRSTRGAEDSPTRSYAGLFRTLTNVAPSSIAEAITEVISSYRKFQPADSNLSADGCSVIIQEMIRPEYAGVAFSQNPLDSNDKSIILNIVPGLGEDLVSGKESALKGIYADDKFTWVNRDDTFSGHYFDQGLYPVSVSGEQIITALQPCLKELIEGVKKLSELKRCPVDIEFAIYHNTIYWLQLRPVTALDSVNHRLIYDNSNIGENYPGTSMPLTISFVQYTYERAYTEMARYLGMSRSKLIMNEPLFKNMVGGIYGSLYYNITVWQQLAYQLPFGRKTSKQITKVLAMEPAGFEIPPGGRPSFFSYFKLLGKAVIAFLSLGKHKRSYLANCEEVLRNYSAGTFKGRSHEELISIYYEMDRKLTSNWLAPVLNGFYAMILFTASQGHK
jgi:pyruvate,water dikinase